ncbi:MAG: DEAD/DEAH box helicase [Hyphomicrobiaceae bacterium]
MTTFTELGLGEPLTRALTEAGYETPTPIQTKAIPVVMTGRDLMAIAQTGTGKTAAFALPILERLAANQKPAARKGCRVLVLSPTRELATQIAESFKTYGKHMGIRVAVIFGGVGHRPQIQAMARGVDVLVATPGRLIDHMEGRNVVVETTEIFVLDEADQMLDLGFHKPIRTIAARLPSRRQSIFLSATMPNEIEKLANELLRDPAKVAVAPTATTVERVAQKVIFVEHARKRALLVELLSDKAMSRTLVFTRTKRGADRVAEHLERAGISVAAIHGNKSQRQRDEALASFRDSTVRVLVATDIAARGIDVDLVTHVINYEMPDVPESYVHRIGRTARAGAAGDAISLVDAEERTQLRDIERVTRMKIPSEDRRNDTSIAADATGAASGPRNAGYRGARPGGRQQRDGRPARAGDGRSRPGQGQGHGRSDGGRDRQPREGRAEAEGSHRGGRAQEPRRGTPERSSGNKTGDIGGVAFLSRGPKPARPQADRGMRRTAGGGRGGRG